MRCALCAEYTKLLYGELAVTRQSQMPQLLVLGFWRLMVFHEELIIMYMGLPDLGLLTPEGVV